MGAIKFKIGDKVKVREGLDISKDYGGYCITTEMLELKNKVLTIKEVRNYGYRIEEDECDFTWTDEMLKKATKQEVEGLEVNNTVEDIKKELENNNKDIDKMLNKIGDLLKEVKEEKKIMKEESPIEKAMTEAIIEKGKEIATKDLEERIKKNLDKFIQENYGILPKQVIIKQNDIETKLEGIFHKDFDKICNIVANDIPLMLVGGAGAGKNYTLEQVAKGLGLTFYSTNAINQEYKLTGFIDANGVYHETEFYKAFKDGGMFFLDEIDASSPEALIILNSAIANRYFDFPVGRINANKDFRVVCAGNTYGTGADMIYVGRNVLDGATLDRFVVLNFDYDEQVEKQLAYDEELYCFIKDLRDAINESNLRYIVSMRALINSTKLLQIGIDKETILKTVIIKNMQIDDINTIVGKLKTSSDWVKELRKLSDV